MISCTEFIPAYSELFHYLHKNHGGRETVQKYWDWIFLPRPGGGLNEGVKKYGLRGCWNHWTHSLNEEAADFTLYLNEKAGWFLLSMHSCPSKGRLLRLQEEIGVEPYPDYCLHCDGYRQSISKYGLEYIYNFVGMEKAACSILVYDPKVFNGQVIVDEHTEIMDRKASDNEYFHRAFHNSLNKGMIFLLDNFGEEEVVKYLKTFTDHVYQRELAAIQAEGLAAMERKILETYHIEKADDAVETHLEGDTLTVVVHYCPAVTYIRKMGWEVNRLYHYTTEVVLGRLAENAGYRFTMESYDHATGAASYRFDKA